QAVTAADVMRVYETYIKDRPFVAASFVPKGNPELAVEGATKADVVEETLDEGATDEVNPDIVATYEPTPSVIDRGVEPPAGPTPVLATPDIWETELLNGLKVLGIEDNELPLVAFRLSIDGGHLRDQNEKNGLANLVAEMMTRGTLSKTPAEFEEALALLGAEISVQAGDEAIVVRGETLARSFDEVMALLEEMMLEPRWDDAEFELARAAALNAIVAQKADPVSLTGLSSGFVEYGINDIRAQGVLGNEASLAALSLEDAKTFFGAYIKPELASFRVVGDVREEQVLEVLEGLGSKWPRGSAVRAEVERTELATEPSIYFYDVPGATQSVLTFQHSSLLRTDEDFYPATVANYILGGGGFASRLMQELREGKGYTYGIFSFFDATARDGAFRIFSQVRSNVTYEATDLIKTIVSDYAATLTDDDLAATKSFFLNSRAREFESFNAKLALLRDIDLFGLPYDYVAKETAIVEAMTLDRLKELSEEYIRSDAMAYVIVGDAETQLDRLEGLGLGDVILVNEAVDSLMTGEVSE
ncbi:MAG: pitrilysin family protein, partial [Pseudomonadota bacterium]